MRGKLPLIFAIWLLQVVNYMDRVVIGFAGPSMMQSLALDPKTFGVILSSFAFGYFLSQVPGGLVADRWGARSVFVIGPLFWALFTGMTGLVASAVALIVVRFLFGVAEGVSNAATYKIVGDNFAEKHRGRAVGIWVTSFALAPALTGPAVGWLLRSYGWQEVFLLMAVPAVIVSVVNYVLIPAHRPAQVRGADARGAASYREVLRQPSLWLISGAYAMWNIAYWGVLGWMPSYLALARHIDLKSSGALAGLPYVFGLIGGVAAGLLCSGFFVRHRPHLLAGVYLLGAVALWLAFAATTLAVSVAGLSVATACIYAGLSTYGALVLDLAPANMRASYTGMVSTVGQVGSIAAPAVIGYLVSETGSFASGFAFMSGALALGAACALALVTLAPARSGVTGRTGSGPTGLSRQTFNPVERI